MLFDECSILVYLTSFEFENQIDNNDNRHEW